MDKKRCKWCLSSEKMIHYHDTYWGTPVHDDQELFAKLVLDMNQAAIVRKRKKNSAKMRELSATS